MLIPLKLGFLSLQKAYAAAGSWDFAGGTNGTGDANIVNPSSTIKLKPDWFSTSYNKRQLLTVNATDAVTSGYSVKTDMDLAGMVDSSLLRPDLNDLRIAAYDRTDKQFETVTGADDTSRTGLDRDVIKGQSINLNGSSQYVGAGDVAISGSFTIEGFVKFNSVGSDTGIFGKSKTSGFAYVELQANNTLRFLLRNESGADIFNILTTNTYTTNTWYHIAAVYDSTSGPKLFVNGILSASSSATGAYNFSSGIFEVGRLINNNARYLNGQVDEIRVSNSARYSANFTPRQVPFVPDANTVGLWHLDNDAGDSSGKGNNGTLNGGPYYTEGKVAAKSAAGTGMGKVLSTSDTGMVGYWKMDENPASHLSTIASATGINNGTLNTSDGATNKATTGKLNGAITFDGTNDYVSVTDSASLQFGASSWAFEVWANPSTITSGKLLLHKRRSGPTWEGIYLGLYGSPVKWFVQWGNTAGTYYDVSSDAVPQANTWTHVVTVVDRSNNVLKMYVNGQLQSTQPTITGDASNPFDLFIGSTGSSGYWNGLIDEAAIYSRALSASEVKEHYNAKSEVWFKTLSNISASSTSEASGQHSYYAYYNYANQGTTAPENKDNVYLFQDGFNSGTLDAAKWTQVNSPTTSISGSVITITTSTDAWRGITSVNSYGPAGIAFKARGSLNSAANAYNNMGFNNSGQTSNNIYYYGAGASNITRTYNGSASTDTTLSGTDSNMHEYEILWASSSSVKFNLDGTLQATHTTNIPTSALNAAAMVWDNPSGNVKMDWVLVRKYTPNEPTIANGSEVDKGTSNNYSSPGVWTSNAIAPTGLYDWGALSFTASGGTSTTVDVLRTSDSAVLATNVSSGTDLNTAGVSNTETSIKLKATLTGGSGTPTLSALSLAYDYETTAPTNPTALTVGSVTASSVPLSWTVSTDTGGSGLAGYKIERAPDVSGSPGTFAQIGTSGTTSYTDSTVSANTKYWYRVRAYDNAGNNSGYSGEMALDSNVKGLWHFNEGTGSTTADSSGNNNTGTLTIGATGTQTTTAQAWSNGVNGKHGQALNFDGTDDYIDTGNGASLNITSAITVEAWVKSTATGTKYIASKQNPGTPDWNGWNFGINWDANGKLFASFDGVSKTSNTLNLNDGLWHYVAFTKDASGNYVLYADGVNVGSGTGVTISSVSANLLVGRLSTTYFSGIIDEVRISNVARSAADIQNYYNESNGYPKSAITLANTPTSPIATAASASQIDLSWTSGGAQDHYHVYSSLDSYVSAIYNSTLASTSQGSLSANTQYTYRIYGVNTADVNSATYATVSKYTLANTPGAPTASNPTSSSLKVVINENSNPANTTYAIYNNTATQYVQANGSLGAGAVYQTYASWGGATGIVNTGLTPNTSYTYKVIARNGDVVDTAFGANSAAVSTLDNVPAAPTIGVASALSTTSIRWNFTDTANNETGFKVHDSTHSVKASSATANLSYLDEAGLTPNTQYTRHVHAYNGAGDSLASANASKYTLSDPPTLPVASDGTTAGIDVSWTASVTANHYHVYRDGVSGSGTLVYNTTGTSFNDNVVGSHTYYIYSVNGDDVENSSYISDTGSSDTTVPTNPTGLTVGSVTTTSVPLSWTASTDIGGSGVAGYKIERAPDVSGVPGTFAQIGTSGTTSYTDSTALANTKYYYRVRAYDNASNNSGYSGEMNVDSNVKGLWHFNEGTGSTTADSSGNGNTGTMNGTSYWSTSGKHGNAFNGSGDDYINGSLSTTSSQKSVETWIKPSFNGSISGTKYIYESDDTLMFVDEGTTNLVTNPSFETGTTSWANSGPGCWLNAGATLTQDATTSVFGSNSLKIVSPGQYYGAKYEITGSFLAGETYIISAYIKSDGTNNIQLGWSDGTCGVANTITSSGSWKRVEVSYTLASNLSTIYVIFRNLNTGAATFYVDGVQLEKKAAATSYADGSLGNGYSWSGTAHASNSTRNNNLLIFGTANNRASVDISSWSANVWKHVVGTYDNTANLNLYVDGSPANTKTATWTSKSETAYRIGSSGIIGSLSEYYFSGLIDEVRISNVARSATDISNYYNESNGYPRSATTLANTPTLPSASAASASQIDLSWTSGGAQDHYHVYSSSDSYTTPIYNSTLTSTSQSSLSANTQYTYRIYGVNSADVNSSTYATVSKYTKIESPSGGSFGTVTKTSIALSATGTLSNLTSGTSGLLFENTTNATNSTWTQTNSWTNGSLSPNTQYTYQTTSRNAESATNTAVSAGTKYTLPADPNVTADKTTSTWYNTADIIFTNAAGFGAGGVAYYRYVFDTNPTYLTWTDTETQWLTGTLTKTAPASGMYYLHVKSYNGENAAGTTADYGPYYYDGAPPSDPSGLSATAASATQINLSWNASTDSGGSSLTGYKIERAPDVSGSPGAFAQIATSATNSYNNTTGLSANTKYWYKTRAYDGASNNSGYTANASRTTLSDPPTLPVASDATYADKINVSWTASATASSYKVYRDGVSGSGTLVYSSTGTSFDDTITGSHTYYIYSANSEAAESASYVSDVGSTFSAPSAPTAGTPTALSTTSIRWSFTDNASNEDGFKVHDSSHTIKASSATANLTYLDEASLTPNTSYTRHIHAYNAAGDSAASADIAKTTLSDSPTLPVVTDGTLVNQVQVSWSASLTANHYHVYKDGLPGVGTLIYNSTGTTITDAVTDDSTHTYYIYSVNSEDANSATYISDTGYRMALPSAPTAGTPAALSTTSIRWNFTDNASNEDGFKVHDGTDTIKTSSATANLSYLDESALSPNTQYTRHIHAYNAAGDSSASANVTKYTLPATPSLNADKTASTWYNSTDVIFTNAASFGAGGVAYYRYAFNQNATHTFNDTETQWSASTLTRVATANGSWYLHVKSFNSDNIANGTQTYGPYNYDGSIPADPTGLSAIAASATQINLSWSASTDTGGSGLTGYKIERAPDVSGSAGTFTQITTSATNSYNNTSLSSNTKYWYRVRAYDNASNNSGYSTSISKTTLNDIVAPPIPSISSSKDTTSWHSSSSIAFSSNNSFGSGGLAYYRYAFNQIGAYVVSGTDSKWSSGVLSLPVPTSGIYYLNIRSYNSANSASTQVTYGPYRFDLDKPSVEIISHTSGDYVKGKIKLQAKATDNIGIAEISFYDNSLDNRIGSSATAEFDTTKYQKGIRTLYAKATDYAGNEAVSAIIVNIDNIKPKPLKPEVPAIDNSKGKGKGAIAKVSKGQSIKFYFKVSDNQKTANIRLKVFKRYKRKDFKKLVRKSLRIRARRASLRKLYNKTKNKRDRRSRIRARLLKRQINSYNKQLGRYRPYKIRASKIYRKQITTNKRVYIAYKTRKNGVYRLAVRIYDKANNSSRPIIRWVHVR